MLFPSSESSSIFAPKERNWAPICRGTSTYIVTRPARIVAPMPIDSSAISIRLRRRSSEAVIILRNILRLVIF